MARLVLLESSRGSRLLCCVALCLLGAGSAAAGVTQSPRHLIQVLGEKAVLKCHPKPGHKSLYWYQQARGQGPQFLISFYEKGESQRGIFPGHFSANQSGDYSSELAIRALQLADSAVYLCASAQLGGGAR